MHRAASPTFLGLALAVASGCGATLVTGDGPSPGADAPMILDGGTALVDFARTDGHAGCSSSADCDGGVCAFGHCCASAASVCGSTCCPQGTLCLFDACVTPGKACHSANDCASGQYCETALGGPPQSDGGIAPTDGATCLAPLPLGGRCLDLPPRCGVDGGAAPGDGGCVAACEYHPPVGTLDAVPKWTWGPVAKAHPNFTDVWSTPAVARLFDGNCDGVVNELDAPSLVFVSGNVAPSNTPRDNGVLRVLDGRTGQEIWSLAKAEPTSKGFFGFSIAIADIDNNGVVDIVAVTGEKKLVVLDSTGKVLRTGDKPIAGTTSGWGGGLAIADMDGDGYPEIAFGSQVYTTTNNALTQRFLGSGASGGGDDQQLSILADVDGAADGNLELVAGRTTYRADGTVLWNRADLIGVNGFPATGDFNQDGNPEVVVVDNGRVWILDGATGKTVLGPAMLPGNGTGGPPTVADFDGDGKPEIGVAQANFYAVLKPNYAMSRIDVLWKMPNHDLSSSVTGSTVFDFEGDGPAEVIYGDECYLWVFDGMTGKVRFATPHTSFTATEASLVADVDGDGHAEIVMVSNGADPSAAGWGCDVKPWNQPDPMSGRPAWKAPPGAPSYRGITVFGDKANGWVGTRTLWNQHAYHVSNLCDARDNACDPPNVYGSVPKREKKNWQLPWLNNYRQNVQDKGIFDAPDATLSLTVDCVDPPVLHATVRNIGLAALPPAVMVAVYRQAAAGDVLLGQTQTTHALYPGQSEQLDVKLLAGAARTTDSFYAKIVIDPMNLTFHECRTDNDQTPPVSPICLQ